MNANRPTPRPLTIDDLVFEDGFLLKIRGDDVESLGFAERAVALDDVAALLMKVAAGTELPLSSSEVSDIAYFVDAVQPGHGPVRDAARRAVRKLEAAPVSMRRHVTEEMVAAFKIAFHGSHDGGRGTADYDANVRIGLEAAVRASGRAPNLDESLTELERLARAAKSGPQHIYTSPLDDFNWPANADFHAMASPDLILSLVSKVRHAPLSDIPPDVFSVHDGGNSITLHFSEIRSAREFRDSFPVAVVSEATRHFPESLDDWRDDPSQDERWNAGFDFATLQVCHVLGVDPATVNWDTASETLEGDARATFANILSRGPKDGGTAPASGEAADGDLAADAERFRALMRCGRIKMQGSAGVDPRTGERNGNNVHFGAEFWPEPIPAGFEEHYEASTKWGRACILALADAILEDEKRRSAAKETAE